MKILSATRKALTLTLAVGITVIFAQVQPPPLSFEVATVKAASQSPRNTGLIAVDTDPAMVRYSNITLKNLVSIAYRFDGRLILSGSTWMESDLYDVAAKLPPGTSKDRVPSMLQTLLAERFKLTVHREIKEQRVYFLLVGKDGPKLKNAAPPDDQEVQQVRGEHPAVQILPNRIIGHAVPTSSLAASLAHVVRYQVVDHTQLTGLFDISLNWTPENGKGNDPDLFAAVQQQLGLKLEPGRAPVEMLLIDRAERTPTEN